MEDHITDHIRPFAARRPGCPTAASLKTNKKKIYNHKLRAFFGTSNIHQRLFLLVLERLRMLDGCLSLGDLRPDIQPPKSLLMSLVS